MTEPTLPFPDFPASPAQEVATLVLNGNTVQVFVEPDLDERGLTTWTPGFTGHAQPPVRIRLREGVADLDGRVLLHEILHVLIGTDPQRVLPLEDPRHEDFVRMLTAGLHDAAGYRRPLPDPRFHDRLAELFPHSHPSNGLVGSCEPGNCWCGADRRLAEAERLIDAEVESRVQAATARPDTAETREALRQALHRDVCDALPEGGVTCDDIADAVLPVVQIPTRTWQSCPYGKVRSGAPCGGPQGGLLHRFIPNIGWQHLAEEPEPTETTAEDSQ